MIKLLPLLNEIRIDTSTPRAKSVFKEKYKTIVDTISIFREHYGEDGEDRDGHTIYDWIYAEVAPFPKEWNDKDDESFSNLINKYLEDER